MCDGSPFHASAALCRKRAVRDVDMRRANPTIEINPIVGDVHAENIEELMENLREAITAVLEVMREQGRQPEGNIQILDIAV